MNNICPVCKKSWIKWANSNLTCHYRCLHTPAEREALLATFEAKLQTIKSYAPTIGMTTHILMAVLTLARKERLEKSLPRRPNPAVYLPIGRAHVKKSHAL